MQITHSYRLVFDCALVPGDLDEVLKRHYGIETWYDAPASVYPNMQDPTYAWGELHALRALEKDIEAGTVWEPPEIPASICDGLYKTPYAPKQLQMPTYQEVLANVAIASRRAGKTAAMIAAQQEPSATADTLLGAPKIGTYEDYLSVLEHGDLSKVVGSIGDYAAMQAQPPCQNHHYGPHGVAIGCDYCGSGNPLYAKPADWFDVPDAPAKPLSTWKHGHCTSCRCELSPAMDGDGATKCKGCTR